MNSLKTIQVDYLRPSRTIETILLESNITKRHKIVYVYNYEGYHYRIFDNTIELISFFNNEPFEIIEEFNDETEIDLFLEKYLVT